MPPKFEKGESGNPSGLPGRTKGSKSPTDSLRKLLRMTPNEIAEFTPEHGADEIALSLYLRAVHGDGKSQQATRAIQEIFQRQDGKVPDKIEGVEDRAIRIVFEPIASDGQSEG